VLLITGCVLVFFVVRQLNWHFEKKPWLPAVPLIALAALEAALGIAQGSAESGGFARGTWVNRNHFADFLAFTVPFPCAWGLAILAHGRERSNLRAGPALRACFLFAVAALLVTACIHSQSRMGFLAALAGLAVVAAAGAHGRFRALLAVAIGATAFVFLPSDPLIGRFAELPAESRGQIWRETAALIRDFPLTGCGPGAYESVMARYKTVAPLNTLDYAHNDYLQLLAETGPMGIVLVLILTASVAVSALRGARRFPQTNRTWLASACLGAFAALALHSFFDFSLHIPANALAASWAAGLAVAPE
jgi:O-antigen ligase